MNVAFASQLSRSERVPPALSDEQVVLRYLRDDERPYGTAEARVPLVIEPRGWRDVASLSAFLAANSASIKRAVYEHGAILLRGFDVRHATDFERTVLSVRGLRAMDGYFMSEAGRERVAGTKGVFETNTMYRSGGDFTFSGFHSENYYSFDVPQFQCFCCFKTPWFGGETALVQMAQAYQELSPRLRGKLESAPCLATFFPLARVARRYQLSEDATERILRAEGAAIATTEGEGAQKWVCCYKPSIYVHPYTKQPSLQVQLSMEAPAVHRAAVERFQGAYQGARWWVHRLAWRDERVAGLLKYLTHLPRAWRHPQLLGDFIMSPVIGYALSRFRRRRRNQNDRAAMPAPPAAPRGLKLKHLLDANDVQALADAVRTHTSVFTWKRGDLLVFDNLQMQHSGMPGFGPRLIQVMLCNPAAITYPVTTGVVALGEPHEHDGHPSLHEKLVALAGRQPA